MKLHLPKSLRQAVLVSMSGVSGLFPSLATGAVAGGFLALANVAMGATLDEADIKAPTNLSYNSKSGTFSIAMTLDVNELRTLLEEGQTAAWGTDIVKYMANGNQTGVTVNGTSYDNKISSASDLYFRWQSTSTRGNVTPDVDTLHDLNGAVDGTGWNEVDAAGLVYTFDKGNGTFVAFTLLDSEGNVIVATYGSDVNLKSSAAGAAQLTFDDSVVSSYYFDSILGEADMKELAKTVATTTPRDATFYWRGGETGVWGNADWSLSENEDATYILPANRENAPVTAILKGTTETSITISDARTVENLQVEGTKFTLTAGTEAEATGSITAASVTVTGENSELLIGSGVTVTGAFSLDGGTLTLGHTDALGEGSTISSTSQGGTIHIAKGATLSQSKMGTLEGNTSLVGDGVYDMEGNLFPTNLFANSSSWNGTVKLSGNTTGAMLSNLGNANSTIEIEGTHTLATGTMANWVTATLIGSGTLHAERQLVDNKLVLCYILFNKADATVDVKITGDSQLSVVQNTTFYNDIAADKFSVTGSTTASVAGIVKANSVTGHIVGIAAPVTQTDTDDRVVKHGTLVAATTGDALVIGDSATTLENVAIGAPLQNGNEQNQLTLKGTIQVDASLMSKDFFKDDSIYSLENGNGFKTKQVVYTVIQGKDALEEGEVTWMVEGEDVSDTYDYAEDVGTVSHIKEEDTTTFWVQSIGGEAVYMQKESESGKDGILDIHKRGEMSGKHVMLKGGTLVFNVTGRDPESHEKYDFTFATNNTEIENDTQLTSTIRLVDNAVMFADDFMSPAIDGGSMIADGTTLLLEGTDSSVFVINDEVSLLKGLKLSEQWFGTVYSTALVEKGQGNLTSLTNGTKSTVQVGKVDTDVLTVGGNIFVENSAALSGGASSVGGYMELGIGTPEAPNRLALGSAEAAAILTVGGKLVTPDGIVYNHAESKVTAGSIAPGTLDIWVEDPEVLKALNYRAARERVVLVELTGEPVLLADEETLAENTLPTARLNGSTEPIGEATDKYFSSVAWDEDRDLLFTAVANGNYVTSRCAPVLRTVNGRAGAYLLAEAFETRDPQATAPEGDMAAIMDAVDAGAMTDKDLAAVAGASIATMGMALSGDVERQLSAIRNRTTSMGVNECVVNEGMPYFNAWVNAEGNRAELDKDGTDAGYKLDSWGGTVGFDVDLNPNFTMGMALTAMYGDLTADGPETKAEGDMDTYYVSLFARYASCAWTHTFVATVGMMDGSLDRTVNVGGHTYNTKGSTDGVTFGLLYEVGYVVPLDEDATACLQPVFNVMLRHTSIGSYTEEDSDAALDVDSRSMTTLTFGLGARMQAVVGESLYNRASIFEARALAKVDLGDRRSETDVAFVGGGRSAEIRSAELGAFGVELGAGLTIPLGDDDGSLFLDGAVELQSGYTNVNATVGYRINF